MFAKGSFQHSNSKTWSYKNAQKVVISHIWKYLTENIAKLISKVNYTTLSQVHWKEMNQAGAELGQAQVKLEVVDEVLAKA